MEADRLGSGVGQEIMKEEGILEIIGMYIHILCVHFCLLIINIILSGPPARRSQYRVVVSGLPTSGSWQDLKDHMREAGDVCYADVYKDGTGVVEFLRHEDMKYAVKKLDDSRFRSHEVTTCKLCKNAILLIPYIFREKLLTFELKKTMVMNIVVEGNIF